MRSLHPGNTAWSKNDAISIIKKKKKTEFSPIGESRTDDWEYFCAPFIG